MASVAENRANVHHAGTESIMARAPQTTAICMNESQHGAAKHAVTAPDLARWVDRNKVATTGL